MQVEKGKIITIAYTLRENNQQGPILEEMDQYYPFKYYYGSGALLPDFEEALAGLKEGEAFAFTLNPEQAYGPVLEEQIIEVPIEVFKENGELIPHLLELNNHVNLTDDLGQTHTGKILSFDESKVKVDFNHIMAGKTLYFKGVVLNIRNATPAETKRKSYIEVGGVRS